MLLRLPRTALAVTAAVVALQAVGSGDVAQAGAQGRRTVRPAPVVAGALHAYALEVYRAGASGSLLGAPVGGEFGPLAGGGYGRHFEGGSVYWSPQSPAVTVRGALRDHWAAAGWENSDLGYPLHEEVALPTGSGYLQQFQGGFVYWSAATGAHTVRGAVFGTWARHGYEWGDLGYPVSEEYDVAGGRRSDFQYGSITWDAATGGTTVTTTGTREPRVTVLGDSLTFDACGGTAQQVSDRAGVRGVACFGWPGATSDELAAYVEDSAFRSAWPGMLLPLPGVDLKSAVTGSDVLVVGLGTNDALRDRARYDTSAWPRDDLAPVPSGHVPVGNGYFDQKIDYFVHLAAGRPVYWYDLGYTGTDAATASYFAARNERLRAATSRWPNLHVLSWSAAVAAHPSMVVDGVHVDSTGNAARWDLLRSALGR